MTKYSTGSSNDPDPEDESASCTMCGSTENLQKGEIAGANVIVCRSCSDGDTNNKNDNSSRGNNNNNNNRNEDLDTESSAYNSEKSDDETSGYTITNPDSSWVEDDRPDYGNARTPYLIPNYSEKLVEEIEELEKTKRDISESTGVPIESVEELFNGNAVNAGVSRESIEAIEKYLDITIIQEDT
jgi:ribosome-binding protein aMBF1 (putative translation factor)